MLESVVFAAIVVCFITAVFYIKEGKKRITTIPGLDPVDSVQGNLPDIQKAGSLHQFLMNLHQKYGPIVSFWWGPNLTVSIGTAELFGQHSKPFNRPEMVFKNLVPAFGTGSIQFAQNTDGRMRHSTYSKCFGTQAMPQYYELFQKLTERFVAKWSKKPAGEHLPIIEWCLTYTIEVILCSTMGNTFRDEAKILAVKHAYDTVMNEVEDSLSKRIVDTSGDRQQRFDKGKQTLYNIIEEVWTNRRQNPPGAGEFLLIDAVLELDQTDEDTFGDLITFFIAGFHTTGFLVTWCLYFLAKHPDIQEKLHKEITRHGQKKIDPENIKDLKYLRQVLEESLRCSVLGPYAARYQDDEIELGGHKIPAGTPVIQALGVSFMDPKIYPEPHKFDPDRFSPENVKNHPKHVFEPFGFAGKRKCPGYRFSLVEATILIAEIIKTFRVVLVEGQEVIPIYGLVTIPKEEIWMTIEKRSNL